MDRIAVAKEMMSKGYNCAQAVAVAFSDLMEVDRSDLIKLAAPFGKGFGGKESLCGAVSGMGFVFGLIYADLNPENKRWTLEETAKLADAFLKKYGSLTCSELLKRKEIEPGFSCVEYVIGAVKIINDRIEEQKLGFKADET